MDTGPTCNTLSYQDSGSIYVGGSELKDSNVKLKLHYETILKPRGQSKIFCQHKNKSMNLIFQVVENYVTPLLSAEAYKQLGLLQVNFAISEDSISQFPNVCEGLGCLSGSYEIAIDHSVSPV